MSKVRVEAFIGKEVTPYIEDLAELRINIFREYPYLYEGSLEYEKRYLAKFAKSENAIVIIAFDGDRVVGALSGIPLSDESDEITKPFKAQNEDTTPYFYVSEALLYKEYRTKMIDVQFFLKLKGFLMPKKEYRHLVFLTINRENDPREPEGYRSLEILWKRLGFKKIERFTTSMSYQEIGESQETPKHFDCWIRSR